MKFYLDLEKFGVIKNIEKNSINYCIFCYRKMGRFHQSHQNLFESREYLPFMVRDMRQNFCLFCLNYVESN